MEYVRFGVSMQPHYNLIHREQEREMIPFCVDQKLAVISWLPLARGLLTGKRTKERNETERAKTDAFGKKLYGADADFAIVERLTEVANEKDYQQRIFKDWKNFISHIRSLGLNRI